MTLEKTMADKLLKKTPHKVWLAGLGALAIAEQEGSDLFQRLVRRGREIEKEAGGAVRIPPPSNVRAQIQRVRALVETKGAEVVSPDGNAESFAARQERRNERARKAFLKEFGSSWSGKAEHEVWEREGRIFTVDHEGTKHVPRFQFDEKGQPRPAVAGVIRALGGKTSNWGLALWLTANSGWLGGRRPVDLLNSEPERVVQAAESEASELVF